MSQPGEHTSLAPHKGETQVAEKGSKKHYQAYGDLRMEGHCDRCGATSSGTRCLQNGKCGVDNCSIVKSGYGSVDTVSQYYCF